MELHEKIHRRLKPFVVEGRIAEPSLVSGPAGEFSVMVQALERGWGRLVLERDLRAALSDVEARVELSLAHH